jgi:hypothetical protein
MQTKKKLKKIIAILIAATIIAAVLAACEEKDRESAQTQTTKVGGSEPTALEEETTTQPPPYELTLVPAYEAERIASELPENDWGGYTFRVLTGRAWKGSWSMLNTRDIEAEEEIGDPINDAVYKRNAILEDKYNFKIKQVRSSDINTADTVNRAVAAGDSSFDAVSIATFTLARNIGGGGYVDLFGVRYIDFEKPWWDQGAVRDLSINHRLYFTSGDFVLLNRDRCPVILFNKQMLTDLGLENPYELVRSGKWTLGKMSEMARTAAADLNGNGRMEIEIDRYGYIFDTLPSNTSFEQGMGVRYGAKDANDLPILIFGSERDFTATQAFLAFVSFKFTRHYEMLRIGQDDRSDTERAFMDNRGLFIGTVVVTAETLRKMDADFGILPMPWLDESQREWGHGADNYHGQGLAVPSFHDGEALDRTGFMLEAISAESRYTVIPAYYDVQLTGKFTRDDESGDMLDIIFNSVVWDIAIVYDWFGFTRGKGAQTHSASNLERERGAVEAAIQKTIDAFMKLE